jgi:general L-amino acid transport system permease protein
MTIDKLLRAQVAFILFSAAYLAEVVRGGLQAIPKGQIEAADALGLGYWQRTRLIILPQALALVIPPLVNTFIGTFKDTSLVIIIGLFDLLGTANAALADDGSWEGMWRKRSRSSSYAMSTSGTTNFTSFATSTLRSGRVNGSSSAGRRARASRQ